MQWKFASSESHIKSDFWLLYGILLFLFLVTSLSRLSRLLCPIGKRLPCQVLCCIGTIQVDPLLCQDASSWIPIALCHPRNAGIRSIILGQQVLVLLIRYNSQLWGHDWEKSFVSNFREFGWKVIRNLSSYELQLVEDSLEFSEGGRSCKNPSCFFFPCAVIGNWGSRCFSKRGSLRQSPFK